MPSSLQQQRNPITQIAVKPPSRPPPTTPESKSLISKQPSRPPSTNPESRGILGAKPSNPELRPSASNQSLRPQSAIDPERRAPIMNRRPVSTVTMNSTQWPISNMNRSQAGPPVSQNTMIPNTIPASRIINQTPMGPPMGNKPIAIASINPPPPRLNAPQRRPSIPKNIDVV